MVCQYNSRLKDSSRSLRKRLTYGEAALWKLIKSKQLGYKFRRQFPINDYVLDFYCIELKLAIEVDGSSHDENRHDYDRKRESDLNKLGIKIIRFADYDSRFRTDDVLQSITNYIEGLSS